MHTVAPHLVDHELQVHEKDCAVLSSTFGLVMAARTIKRPMRPKPLMLIEAGMVIEQMVVGRHGAREAFVHSVVLRLVDHELRVHEGNTHCLELNLQVGDGRTENKTIDAAETIDSMVVGMAIDASGG